MSIKKSPNLRNRELAQIHVAKKDLGLDDDTYRAMLWTIGRVQSSKDLDHAGRRRVIEHLQSRGWNGPRPLPAGRNDKPRKPNEWAFIDSATSDKQPLLRKIVMLCKTLEVGKAYAEGVAKRQHGIERHLEMMTASELWLVVGALERTRVSRATGR